MSKKDALNCIRSFWEGAEPTEDGGYRIKYQGQWYKSKPVDEAPKCDCGFDLALLRWEKEK